MGFFRVKNNQPEKAIVQRNQDANEGYDRVRQTIAEKDTSKTISEMQKQEQVQTSSNVSDNRAYVQEQEPEPVNQAIEQEIQEEQTNQLYSAKDVLKMLKANKDLETKERLIMIRNIINEVMGDNKK